MQSLINNKTSSVSVFYIGILKTEEIENSVNTDRRNTLLCLGFHFRLGVEGNAQTRLRKHRKVVGSVSYSYGLSYVYILYLRQQSEQFSLTLTVNYISHIVSGKSAVLTYLKFVGIYLIEPETLLKVIAEISKTSGENSCLIS